VADYTSQIEDTIEIMRAFVEANVSTYLDGITALKNDGISLDHFLTVKQTSMDPSLQQEYPACLIYPSGGTIEQVSMGTSAMTIEMTIVVAITKTSPDEMVKRLDRYVDALRQLLRDYQTLSGQVSFARMKEFTVIADDEELKMGLASVGCEVTQDVPN